MRELSIGDIAHRWRFRTRHISRTFRARYGKTPTQHRRMLGEVVQVSPHNRLSELHPKSWTSIQTMGWGIRFAWKSTIKRSSADCCKVGGVPN
ncbi:AraC family transcriptional regulator [Comamonas odontotermitis]|nr:AraC family transcriptional regulator [Comamonas odontotermitis]